MNIKLPSLFPTARFRRLRALALASLAVPALAAIPAHATVSFIGKVAINGLDTDKSGLDGSILQDTVSPNNGLNGFGSSITYAGGNLFYALPDRGPNKIAYTGGAAVDNTLAYQNRYEQFSVSFSPVGTPDGGGHYASYNLNVNNVGTTLLRNAQGVQYLGLATAFSTDPNVENHRLDTEAIRVAPDGTTWVSDEYGPYILHFNREGQEIGKLTLPAGYQPATQGNASQETVNTTGRVTNQGMEGLAITPDGKTLVGMMQSSLIQDGGKNGTTSRVIVYDLTNPSAAPKQYMYQLHTGLAVSELLAVNSHQFLVDERDGTAGGGTKALYEFDLNQATPPTDLTNTAYAGTLSTNGLPNTGVPSGVTPLASTLFANIGSILQAATGAFTADSANFKTNLPDKIEGFTWGPDLPDGRHVLLATNDNDFVQPATSPRWANDAFTSGTNGYPNYIWAFAVDSTDTPGFQAQTFAASTVAKAQSFASDPVQGINHIIVIYQENWSFDGLYGSFPGANGLANASNASTSQLDRITGSLLSGETTYSNAALSGVSTANPPPPLTADSNNSPNDPNFVPTPDTLHPWALSSFINPTVRTGDIYHRYWQEQYQVAGTVTKPDGTVSESLNNNGFVTWSDNPGLVMSHFDATNLPEGLLAQQYTICDNFFHSAFGGSFLNHQFLIAAAAPVYYNMPTSNNGNIAYLDPNGIFVMNTSGSAATRYARDGSITPVVGDVISASVNGTTGTFTLTSANCQPYFGAPGTTFGQHYVVNTTRSVNLAGNGELGFPANPTPQVSLLPSQNDSNPSDATRPYIPTIGDELSQANVSWKWYSGGWTQIVGYSGSNPNPTTSPSYATANASLQLQYHHQPLAYYDNYAPFGTTTVPTAYVGGFAGVGTSGLAPNQSGVTKAQNAAAHLQDETNFFTDVQNNTLPAVSFIKPVGVNNEHPGYAALQTGQAHVASIVQAVQANPALWAHTAIIVTYDEHGGRWDHVTPPARDIWGPGERVPCLVISPFAKKGYVDHAQRDTTSILTTIETRFNLDPLNQLDASASNLFDTFSSLNVTQGAFSVNRATRAFTQNVTVTNIGSSAVTGPVQLVLDNLVATTALNNATGTAQDGSPYITVSPGNLAAGASVTVTLQFKAPTSGGITYTARTVSGTANP